MNNVFDLAYEMLKDPVATAQHWHECSIAEGGSTLHETASFGVYHSLANYGPKNDHDGTRTAALALKARIDFEIIPLYNRLRK